MRAAAPTGSRSGELARASTEPCSRTSSEFRSGERVRASTRVLASVLAGFALALLTTARWLVPAPSGRGTHVALGLPPCGFLRWFGLPCPTCGLTTSFAELARFELARSLRAHPLGLPLFVLTILAVPLALHTALRGEPLASMRAGAQRWAALLMLTLLATWLSRLIALAN